MYSVIPNYVYIFELLVNHNFLQLVECNERNRIEYKSYAQRCSETLNSTANVQEHPGDQIIQDEKYHLYPVASHSFDCFYKCICSAGIKSAPRGRKISIISWSGTI